MPQDGVPIIKVGTSTSGPVLSPNVPEPTSYPGRNYINLNLPDEYFSTAVRSGSGGPGGGGSPGTPIALSPGDIRTLDAGTIRSNVVGALRAGLSGSGLFANSETHQRHIDIVADPDATISIVGNEQVSPKLQALSVNTIASAASSSNRIALYRSMFGTITYKMIADLPERDGGDGDPGHDPPDPPEPSVTLQDPHANATVSGPSTGANITVHGITRRGRATGVQVDFGGGNTVQATPGSPNNFSQWSAQAVISSSGTKVIQATASFQNGGTANDEVQINVVLLPPNLPDSTPPDVTITSPVDGAPVRGPLSGVAIQVSGTASDSGSGVRIVELYVDSDVAHAVTATPHAQNDWSSWSGSVTVKTTGEHRITARSADVQGNVREVSIVVRASIVGPTYRLLLIECYRLSSYLGDYGAGRVLKTFSLLPGEATRLNIRSYLRRSEDANSASSVLDSFTQNSADDFENTVTAEQSSKQGHDESFKYHVDAKAGASWGWGSAEISAGISGSTNSCREEFSKNLSNALQKHSASSSAKREVQVNTSYEVKTEQGDETSVERAIQNINVSRTLNFVFRQMNQEFISLLHLTDGRVAFFKEEFVNGQSQTSYTEVSLPQLDSLLARVIVPEHRSEVKDALISQLTLVWDFEGTQMPFIEETPLSDATGQPIPGSQFLRVKKITSKYPTFATVGNQIEVPGVIMAANVNVMRTEGIIVDALLGVGQGLDDYSQGLQGAAILEKQAANVEAQTETAKLQLALDLIKNRDTEAAKLFAQLFPCCPDQVCNCGSPQPVPPTAVGR
jgi:hypothetical protein